MQELERWKIANIMDLLIEDCGNCPLERICNEMSCAQVWKSFFDSKVKEDGVETCRN